MNADERGYDKIMMKVSPYRRESAVAFVWTVAVERTLVMAQKKKAKKAGKGAKKSKKVAKKAVKKASKKAQKRATKKAAPAGKESAGTAVAPVKEEAAASVVAVAADTVYELEAILLSGPMTEAFSEKNPVVMRVIEIRADQTLDDLHFVIFDAFDREDEHLYQFQFGEGPFDTDGLKYERPLPGPSQLDDETRLDATRATMGSLELSPDRVFGYWFDFGDDWYHRIHVKSVGEARPGVTYPRVTARTGESPPQYADPDEE